MKIISRIALLSLCGLLGITLAIYVASLISPGSSPVRRWFAATSPTGAPISQPDDVNSQSANRAEDTLIDSVERNRDQDKLPAAPRFVQPLRTDPDSMPVSRLASSIAEPQLPVTALVQLITALESRRDPPEPALVPPAPPLSLEATDTSAESEEPSFARPPTRSEPEELISPANAPASSNLQSPASSLPPTPSILPPVPVIEAEGDNRLRVHIQDEDLRTVLQLLSEQGGRNILAGKSVEGRVSASLNGVDVDTALQAILKSTGFTSRTDANCIYVGTPQDFLEMERNQDRIATRIYRPNYVMVQDLQALITGLLTEGVGKISVTNIPESGISKDENKTGGENYANGGALLVQDYESVLAEVDQIVAEIDVRPMQVSIEAMILSVALDDTFKFGVDFAFLRDKQHVALATGSPLASLGSVAFDGGLKFAFLDSSLGTFITALETVGDTNVIATPRLMCLNKQRAEILIGEQLGYVNTTVTETSATQSVEFLEVGAQLRLRPFIYSDGSIRMEIHPELSTGSVEVQGGFTLPKKDVTQVTTNIMVRDGCTVVIGGLMREDLERNNSQVPFLGAMPVVGGLFRTHDEHTRKREILVLVTPRIVYDPGTCAEGDQAACEINRRQRTVEDSMSPIGQRYLGRKHYRTAMDAWEAGEKERAWRHVRLAVHFDPLSRDALALQARVGAEMNPEWARGKLCPADAPQDTSHPLEGDQIAPWLLDDLQQPTGPTHPLDGGQPGRKVEIERPRSM